MKIKDRNINGIIFDLDGTLFDSCSMWHQIDVDFFARRGMELPEDYAENVSHLGLKKAANYTKTRFSLKQTEDEIIEEWNDQVIYQYANNVKLKPYVVEMLTKYKKAGIKMGIATANSSEYYMPCLTNNHILDFFDTIHDVSKTKEGKDNPEIYLYVCSKLGLKPEEVAVFEDNAKALDTAKKAGFFTVAVDDATQAASKEDKIKIADIFVESFKELI